MPIQKVPLLLLLCAPAIAQAAATATATQSLVVSSAHGSAQLPAGPVPAAGTTLATPGSATRARCTLVPTTSPQLPGSTGWSLGFDMTVYSYLWAPESATVSGRVELQFSSPQAVQGVLFLEPDWSNWPQLTSLTGDASIDIDGNGLPDAFASSRGPTVELPCTLGPTPFSVTLDWQVTGTMVSPGFGGGSGSMHGGWVVQFVPSTYALETYATGCAPLSIQRTIWSNPPLAPTLTAFSGTGPNLVFGAFVLGFGEQQVPLPLAPFCPLLVDNPFVAPPTSAIGNQIDLQLPHLALPPGLQLRCQALWLDAAGQVISTDAVRSR